ncbi:MAG: hypothetical protein NTW52_14540 [Planctomycetota bacterium]|nr:hypothetical protein [Planctomycetota bacterium]
MSIETKQQAKTVSSGATKASAVPPAKSVTAPAPDSAVPAQNIDRRSNSGRPWSTNVILLGIGFAVVGLLFKNSGSNSAPVANNPAAANAHANSPSTVVAANLPQATAVTSADSQPTKTADLLIKTELTKPDPSFSLEPLAAPKLPTPMILSLGNESSGALTPSSDTMISSGGDLESATASKSVTVSSQDNVTMVEESLSLGIATQSSIDFIENSSASKSSLQSVAIPNSVTRAEPSVAPKFTQTNFANGSDSTSDSEKTSSGSTVITNTHVLASREPTAPNVLASSQVISTSTPDLETEELFKLRTQHSLATMESQQQAMGMGRQPMTIAPQQQQATAQWNPATGTFGPNATMVSGQTQSRPSYIAPAVQSPTSSYQPVQTAPQGYGAPQVYGAPQTFSAPQINSATANIPTAVNVPSSAPVQKFATATATASVRQPYVPISGSFNPERFGLPETAPNPNQPAIPSSGQNSTPVPVSGGYQPLSPQFQYQPTNGN